MTIAAASQAEFVSRFGHLFEYSPWVVERAWTLGPFASADALHAAFMQVIASADDSERLQLARAHPQLADKAAIAKGLTRESTAEQASAGLDRLTPSEYQAFHALNRRYWERFGFPFIICVRLHDKAGILAAMKERLERHGDVELVQAIAEIGLISRLRLDDALSAATL